MGKLFNIGSEQNYREQMKVGRKQPCKIVHDIRSKTSPTAPMRSSLLLHLGVLAVTLLFGPVIARSQQPVTKASPVKPGERGVLKFEKSPPQSEEGQIRMRFHASDPIPAYDVTKEEFDVLVPRGYQPSVRYGLFIWISAGKTTALPADWESVLAEKKLILIAARNSGNPRSIFDRFRMAVDANVNARELWNVDGRRVYVSGFSGGSRVASELGVAFAEMFSGTACFMGVNFYDETVGTDGKKYSLDYIPDDQVLAMAKKFCRYAMVTGSKDFNRPNTLGVEQAFRKEGFANVKVFDVPNQAHAPPAAIWLKQVLDYLDEGKAY